MGRTAESDSVSDASASLGKSTSSSQVGAAFLDAVAAVDMFQKRHGTSVLPLRRIDTRAPVMEGDGPRVCALVCPLRALASRATRASAGVHSRALPCPCGVAGARAPVEARRARLEREDRTTDGRFSILG